MPLQRLILRFRTVILSNNLQTNSQLYLILINWPYELMQIMTRYDFVPRGPMSAFGQCCSLRPGKRANVREKNCGLGILLEFFLKCRLP